MGVPNLINQYIIRAVIGVVVIKTRFLFRVLVSIIGISNWILLTVHASSDYLWMKDETSIEIK